MIGFSKPLRIPNDLGKNVKKVRKLIQSKIGFFLKVICINLVIGQSYSLWAKESINYQDALYLDNTNLSVQNQSESAKPFLDYAIHNYPESLSAVQAMKKVNQISLLGGNYWIDLPGKPGWADYLLLEHSWVDRMELFQYRNNKLVEIGFDGAKIEVMNQIRYGLTAIKLANFSENEKTNYLLNIQSTLFDTQPKLTWVTQAQFQSKQFSKIGIASLITGGLLSLMLFNLFLFKFAQLEVCIRYSALLGAIIVAYPAFMQLYPVWLVDYQPTLILMFLASILLAMLWFASGYLKLKVLSPKFYITYQGSYFLITTLLVFTLLSPPGIAFVAFNACAAWVSILNIVTGYIRWKEGSIEGFYYLIASAFVPIGFFILRSAYLGLFDTQLDIGITLYTCFFIESIMLSLAIGALYRKQIALTEKANREALSDSLTGLLNRRAFMTQSWLKRQDERQHEGWAIVMADLDNLKKINDSKGHKQGDELILLVSKRLKTLTNNAQAFRLGGDEFAVVIILDNMQPEIQQANTHVIEKNMTQIEIQVKKRWPEAGLSYGIHCFESIEELHHSAALADQKMYEMKSAHHPEKKYKKFRSEDYDVMNKPS